MVSEALLGRNRERTDSGGKAFGFVVGAGSPSAGTRTIALLSCLPRYSGDVPRHPFVREWRSPPYA